ncbi:response regulator [Flavobacterium sp. JLP]|uniref:response regulator n=1 Tax=unclassified Flavobacterium TaxID=196869 RepID=UPI00049376C7|nr:MULTISPECIES: response regulator [unclassified Flavobacterium]MBF4493348.1 response regulator [Flavobacterium sp. MR2016-29]MBF4507861.1 response regulator [Flavobacterium sp. JLP]
MDKKIILLADDDMDDTDMFREALVDIDENIICHIADNGSEALKILNELDEKPNLIFLDLNMPIMNGWDCLKLLKKDKIYQDIPVIMISTSSHKNDIETAASLGAICYFVKPNSYNNLKQILQSITANLGAGLKSAIDNLQKSQSENIFGFH